MTFPQVSKFLFVCFSFANFLDTNPASSFLFVFLSQRGVVNSCKSNLDKTFQRKVNLFLYLVWFSGKHLGKELNYIYNKIILFDWVKTHRSFSSIKKKIMFCNWKIVFLFSTRKYTKNFLLYKLSLYKFNIKDRLIIYFFRTTKYM